MGANGKPLAASHLRSRKRPKDLPEDGLEDRDGERRLHALAELVGSLHGDDGATHPNRVHGEALLVMEAVATLGLLLDTTEYVRKSGRLTEKLLRSK